MCPNFGHPDLTLSFFVGKNIITIRKLKQTKLTVHKQLLHDHFWGRVSEVRVCYPAIQVPLWLLQIIPFGSSEAATKHPLFVISIRPVGASGLKLEGECLKKTTPNIKNKVEVEIVLANILMFFLHE